MSSLAVVVWSAGSQLFALEASRVRALQPYSPDPAPLHLHQLLPGLVIEPALFCLGCQTADDQLCWLAIGSEPQHVQLSTDSIQPLPAALQHARQHPALRALAWYQNRPLTVLDGTLLS